MIRAYYLLTPLFILLDLACGWSVRVAGLESLQMRFAYYGLCLACAALVWARPGWQSFVGLMESAVNFGILIVSLAASTFLPSASADQSEVLTLPALINFLLVGSVLIACFQHNLWRLRNNGDNAP